MKKEARPLSSVVLDIDNDGNSLSEEIKQDILKFREKKTALWYQSIGVPYRRGYTLHGPPGTGKTSFILAIAGDLKMNICYLDLAGGNLNDDGLNRLLNNCPDNSIILLEDMDAIFDKRESVLPKRKYGGGVSFSGLLNALDGVRS